MMDDTDTNRNLDTDLYPNRRRIPSAGLSWGAPVGVAALLLLAGVMFYNSGGHGPGHSASYTPSTNGPVAPGAPAPGPTSTAPAPNR